MTSNRFSFFVLIVAIIALAMACSSPPPSGNTGEQDSIAEPYPDTISNKPIQDILDIGIPEVLNANVDYNESLTNPREYLQEYLLSDDKAATNLGIYGTDALYLSLYNKTQEYIQYSTDCQRIATELGVREAFSPEVIRRLEDNIGNSDSIYSILCKSIQNADNALKADGQERLAGLVATGSLTESLHILCHSFNSPGLNSKSVDKLRQAIIKQQDAVRRVRNRLAALPKDKVLSDLQDKLGKLEAAIAVVKDDKNASLKGVSDLVRDLRSSIIN